MESSPADGEDDFELAPDLGRSHRTVIIVVAVAVVAVVAALTLGVLLSSSDDDVASPAVCQATQVAQGALPSVVTILAKGSVGSGSGSGSIVATGGYIVTNDHVISTAADSGRLSVLYSDGQASPATIVGRDVTTDLAVIKATDGAEGRPLMPIGSSEDLQVGQPVVALGAPLGLSSTVTGGIVSALGRFVPLPVSADDRAYLVGAIQTDAAINPGNSGGALVDCEGALVGVNTAIKTVPNSSGQAGGGSVGLGFAIPVDFAYPITQQLITTGAANHPTLGVQAQPMPTGSGSSGAPAGLFVVGVDPGGPAASAGLRPGDIITTIDGKPARSPDQLVTVGLGRQPGDTVEISYWRDGSSDTTTVVFPPES